MSVPTIVPAPVRALIEVFDEHLADLNFPDLDRGSLHAHAEEVGQALAEVEAARARLESARAALEDAQSALLHHARKGLAYARIYAEDDDALQGPLAAIAFDDKKPRRPRKRRARKKIETAPLPLEQEALRVAS